jgi:hypothetical protein
MTIAEGSEHEHHAGRNDAHRSMFVVRRRRSTDDGARAMFVVLSGRVVGRFRRFGGGRMHPGLDDVVSRGTAFADVRRGGIAIPAGTAFDPLQP